MIHKFTRAGMNIVMDIGSGAVHIIDEIAYNLLDEVSEQDLKNNKLPQLSHIFLENYSENDIKTAFDELCGLCKDELLYTDDSYEEFKGKTGIAPVKAMCLNIAHDCNLRCKYCFASTGSFCGTRKLMEFETAKKAIDMLIELSEGRHNLEVDFFGGEPLMNFGVVKQTVEYSRSLEEKYNKNFRFTITTNGILLDKDKQDFINKEMNNCVLSLDGRKEVNDNLRKRINGEGCYDSIVPRFQELV
ncbi:MAG: 4Fe-4S cluster-binding domain-containing protein, partial [Oscillospiraceae bacterium]